jgi:dienelactone hydrolase
MEENNSKPGRISFSRRQFINVTSVAGLYGVMKGAAAFTAPGSISFRDFSASGENPAGTNLIGPYGKWASERMDEALPSFSFRRDEWRDIEKWRTAARKQAGARIAMPDLGGTPEVKINKQYQYDGLHIEEVSWQLPYGRPTEAILLKPANATGPLPGILAFHEHGGKKYFGNRKITRTGDSRHPHIEASQQNYYEGVAWANEIARRGYVVLVHDAFPFASRRVMIQDVPDHLRQGLTDNDPENPDNIDAYNSWAARHENVMAKSLFCAGTTWPGVWLAEDKKALDVLCARKDVDAQRIGCGGLSGGGMRTVFIGGMDPRIKCSVCVGLMTTWKDFLLYKSQTHTWMTFVPLLPNELDFPEILGLSVPSPTLVINAEQDGLFTLPEMKQADRILREVYDKANASERYRGSFHPGPHKFTRKMQAEAFDWFDRWLK